MKRIFLILLLAANINPIHAQGELPVDMNTGRPIINIPLVTASSHELSDNIYLSYNATGVRVQEPSGFYGVGWGLVAGGTVRRQVRGLPDDFKGTGMDTRIGWLFVNTSGVTMANEIGSDFLASSDTIVSTYTDESQDYTKLSGYSYNYDTEPDIFSYQLPGFSGQFVFDNSLTPVIRLVPYADVKISYTQDPVTFKITSFTITTNDGVSYTFSKILNETRKTTKIASTVDFMQRGFSLYDGSRFGNAVGYTIEWKITQILSPLGATLSYAYGSLSPAMNLDTLKVTTRNTLTGSYANNSIYSTLSITDQAYLYSVSASTGTTVTLAYTSNLLSSVQVGDTRISPFSTVKTINFTYYIDTVGSSTRSYLSSVQESSGCDQKPPYVFYYNHSIPPVGQKAVYLPGPFSKSVDFWGYYNGRANTSLAPTLYFYPQLPKKEQIRLYPYTGYNGAAYIATGADRTPDAKAMTMGTLNNIQWPNGGSTTLQYEPHQYFDALTGQNLIGGGLRIKSVTYYDGLNPSSNITKNFVYADSTKASPGRLIYRPAFAIPTGQATGDWTYAMARTENDLAQGENFYGSEVAYTEVSVYRPGSGHVRYQYLMPGTYGAGANGNWIPTQNKFARAANAGLGPITSGGAWMYNYSPNPNFNHERMLPWQVREYNEADSVVKRTRSYYQYIYRPGQSAPSTVYGLDYENLPWGPAPTYFFAKYRWLTDVNKVLKTEKVTSYARAPGMPVRSQTASTDYVYGTVHSMVTAIKQTAPDGAVYTTEMLYPLDYGNIPTGSDTTSLMISMLQSTYRNGTPVEQFNTILKPDSTEQVTGGSVVRYNNFSLGSKVLPRKVYQLNLSTPVPRNSFQPSHVDGPSKTFKLDSHYEAARTFLSYDDYGNLQGSVGMDNIARGVMWGYSYTLPTFSYHNATADQVGFSDFETLTLADFTVLPPSGYTAYYGAGHTGAKALYPSAHLIKGFSKANVSNYVLSFWVNSSTPLTFTLTIENGVNRVAFPGYPITFTVPATPAGSSFSYFSKMISVKSVDLPIFTVDLQASSLPGAPAAGPVPLIDNVAFYPEGAEVSGSVYNIPYGVSAVTTGNQAAYTVYDGLGRKKYVLDTYKNIREKTSYAFQSLPKPALTANIHGNTQRVEGMNTFTAAPNCVDGAIYKWRLNNTGPLVEGTPTPDGGSTINFNVNKNPSTIQLTVSHPLSSVYPDVTVTQSFNVAMAPASATICASGAGEMTWNCATAFTVMGIFRCSGITPPTDPTGTTFAVTSLSVNESIASYQWMTRASGATTWSPSGTSPQYTVDKMAKGQVGYDVQCIVTTVNGRTATSNVMTVIVDNNCPQN